MDEFRIIELTARHFNITVEQVLSKSQKQNIVLARAICVYVFKNYLLFTYREISEYIQQDHTTMMHGIKKIDNMLYSRNTNESIIAQAAIEAATVYLPAARYIAQSRQKNILEYEIKTIKQQIELLQENLKMKNYLLGGLE